MAHLDGLAAHKLLQGIRQLARFRHTCPVDQNRDDTNVTSERSRDFDRNEVVWMVESSLPASSFTSSQRGPMTTRMTSHAATWLFRCATKSTPGRNVVDIHEEIFSPECLCQSVVQPTSRAGRIFSAIIDENRVSHGLSGFNRKVKTLTAASGQYIIYPWYTP